MYGMCEEKEMEEVGDESREQERWNYDWLLCKIVKVK